MRCRTLFMNAIPFPLLFAASVTQSEKKAMSTPLTPFQGAQLCTAAIFNGLANASDSSHISSPLDNSLLSSRSFGSAPTTPFSGSLLSAPNILSPIHNTLDASMGLVDKENGAYIRLMHQYNHMEEELRNEKQNHNLLK